MRLACGILFLCIVLALPALSSGAVSVNIPAGDSVVRDIERLEVKGLIKSGMLSTRPLSRYEAARLTVESEGEYGVLRKKSPSQARDIIERLHREFRGEIEGFADGTYLKPLERAYVSYLYGGKTPYFKSINNSGDSYASGSNIRAGLQMSARLGDSLILSLNPEYRLDERGSGDGIKTGYIAAEAGNFSLQVGKDSMWWGSGAHGGLIMTDNAKPLEMIKASAQRPFLLPWIFGRMGLFKPTVFLARLEKERSHSNPNLLGMRLDFKPTDRFQIGFNRVFMFGGEGRRSLSASEWLKVFIASDSSEHTGSPIDGNQIASIDASYVYVNDSRYLPFSGVKLYTEWGAEDSSGDTKTPSGRANIYGAYIDEPAWLGDVDLRVEWANTARSARYGPQWYYHGTYYPGYTYKGAVIGHHMGGDSKDLFARLQYHASARTRAAIETDHEENRVHSASTTNRRWIAADLSHRLSDGLEVTIGAGIQKTGGSTDQAGTAATGWMSFSRDF